MIAGLTMRSNRFMASSPALASRGNLTIPPHRATLQGQAGPKALRPPLSLPIVLPPAAAQQASGTPLEETI